MTKRPKSPDMVHSTVEARWRRHLEPIERRERAYGRWYALTWSQLTGLFVRAHHGDDSESSPRCVAEEREARLTRGASGELA